MGGFGNDERFDIFGRRLARARVLSKSMNYLGLPELDIRPPLYTDYVKGNNLPALAAIIEDIMPNRYFCMKEFEPANDPELIDECAKFAVAVYNLDRTNDLSFCEEEGAAMNERERLERYFRELGAPPCSEAGLDESITGTCPKAGQGGCYGRYGECDRSYIDNSADLRLSPVDGLDSVSFKRRFQL
jgi:hypothetical protein